MKTLWALLPPFVKGALSVVIFFISLGWASYGAVLLIVKAEGQDIRREVMEVRKIDIEHIDGRFDEVLSEIRELRKEK